MDRGANLYKPLFEVIKIKVIILQDLCQPKNIFVSLKKETELITLAIKNRYQSEKKHIWETEADLH